MRAMAQESISAIRAVRLAAHQLSNACTTVVGGTEMALATVSVNHVGEPVDGWRSKFSRLWKM